MSKNGSTLDYKYDATGIRIQKVHNGKTTNYTHIDGKITSEETNSEHICFRYDEEGNLVSLTYNYKGNEYFYQTNIQGDIIGIVDINSNVVVEYTYDAWGNHISITGTLSDTLGQANSMRYRSYYFDIETGLHYLQSRYYNPEFGRFINADIILEGSSLTGTNIFAYCGNNPIMMSDESDYLGKHWWNSVKWVGRALDVVLIVISLGKTYSSWKALKELLKKNKDKLIRTIRGKIMRLFGSMVSNALKSIIEVALTMFGHSIGEMIAKAIDYADGWWGYRRNNGYLLN